MKRFALSTAILAIAAAAYMTSPVQQAAAQQEFITIGTGEIDMAVAQSDWQYHA